MSSSNNRDAGNSSRKVFRPKEILMFQVVEGPVAGEAEQVRKYGAGEIDRVSMIP